MTTVAQEKLPTTYAGLNRGFPLRPIRDDAEVARATRVMEQLAVRDRLTVDQTDYLEVLGGLIEAYEEKHKQVRWPNRDPIAILRFLLKESGMSASDLGRLLGQRQLGSAILRGQRELSKAHIKRLADHFHVDAGLFFGEGAQE